MSSLLDDDFFPAFSHKNNVKPAVNIREDEKSFMLDLAIPGIDKKDLKIDMNDDVLTISSEIRKENEHDKDGYKRMEFSYSSFCRSFRIPENVNQDKIAASYKDGILSITLPKLEEEKMKKAKEITIS